MFKLVTNMPESFYAFLSGVFITISTTAAGNIVLSEIVPTNRVLLIQIALVTLIASVLWISLSESVSNANQQVEKIAVSMSGKPWENREKAIEAVSKDLSARITLLLLLALFFSIAWIGLYFI